MFFPDCGLHSKKSSSTNPIALLFTISSTTSPQRFFLPNPHLYLHRSTIGFLSNVKSIPSPPKGNVSFLRLRSFKLTHPFAALSSFAEAEGEDGQKDEIQLNGHHQNAKTKEDNDLPGMATAFNISSHTASAISISIAFAALSFPFFMSFLGQNLALKTKLLSYATLLFGFYMAWNIGANDVANAMGTSVGSGALTLQQAVMTAAVLEFSGAFLIGTHVTSTMQKGILVANAFQGKDTLLFAGLLSSLAAAGTWLQVASYFGWPMSTTHCIVGAMVGFGLVYAGAGAVFWGSLARNWRWVKQYLISSFYQTKRAKKKKCIIHTTCHQTRSPPLQLYAHFIFQLSAKLRPNSVCFSWTRARTSQLSQCRRGLYQGVKNARPKPLGSYLN